MNTRWVLLFTVLVAAALGSWYLSRAPGDDDPSAAMRESVHRGFYLKSARILGTGADGHLLYEIHADHAEEQDDGTIEFRDVRFDYSPGSDIPWAVDADSATILPNEKRVQLSGHVRAVSQQGFSGEDTEIRTQYLELDPEAHVAETDQRVQVRIGARSLTATGMLASLDESRLVLQSNVSGKFVP